MDKEQFILSTIPKMAAYTFPYLTSVIGIVDELEGRHVGSGLRCIVDGRRAIATALHVITEASKFPKGFALSAGYGQRPYPVSGPVKIEPKSDLALFYLPEDFAVEREDVDFWPIERSDKTAERLSTDYLFAHGFPGVRSRFLWAGPGVASKSLPYGAMQRLENLPPHLKTHQFALDFDPANMKSTLGSEQFEMPAGLSGSPVWRIGISGRAATDWKPDLALLVGFLTEWYADEKVLVASRVNMFPIPMTS